MELKKKVVIADSNTFLREGLSRILTEMKDVLVVGEATNDVEAVEVTAQTTPDVLLLDLVLPKLEAVPILLAIREQNLLANVLIMSTYPDESKILTTAKAGARGYILKTTPATTLIEAVREVGRGRIWVDRQLGCADSFALLSHRAHSSDDIGGEINPLDVLSKREIEILHLIGRGMTNEQIGKKLFISMPTVKVHAAHIFDKLNVKNRTQAALLLMQSRVRHDQDFAAQFAANRNAIAANDAVREG
jgi:DNA-binding NarL/FixJ family response regulator